MNHIRIFLLFAAGLLVSSALKAQAQHDTPRCPVVPGVVITPDPDPFLDGQDLPLIPHGPEVHPPVDPPTDTTWRGMYWVHGLAGSAESWNKAQYATDFGRNVDTGEPIPDFPARKTTGICPEYSENGMSVSVIDLAQKIERKPVIQNTDSLRNFVIAASQGGIVSRGLDHHYELYPTDPSYHRMFFGIATFCSPHLGAPILNSRDEGRFNELAADACSSILYPLVQGALSGSELLSFFISPGTIKDSIDVLCSEENVSQIIPFFLGSFEVPTTNAYKVGATGGIYAITELNEFGGSPGLRKAAFYGVEYDSMDTNTAHPKQLVWRTFTSFLTNTEVFQNNDDSRLVNEAAELHAKYTVEMEAALEEMEVIEDYYGFCLEDAIFYPLCVFHPEACLLCIIHRQEYSNAQESAEAYGRSVEFMDRVNEDWMTIIGAKVHTTNYEYYCGCNIHDPGDLDGPFYSTEYPYCDNIQVCRTVITNQSSTTTYYESDGIVPVYSQIGFPGVTNPQRMKQTNHFQARNCEETKDALLNLYGGSVEPWFQTEER